MTLKRLDYRLMAAIIISVGASSVFARNLPDSIQPRELREIVVTGSNEAVDGRRLPYTVSVVGRAEIESASSNRILDILPGRVPSFFVTGRNVLGYGVSNGGAGHIKMRGVGGDRASAVLMMVDGQPQFAGIYSHHIGDFYTRRNVERVEVLRGPGSVLYGSNAMAGVVNVVTRGVHREGFHGSADVEYGSHNTLTAGASGQWRRQRLWATASVGYDRTDGTVEGFDFNQISAYAKAGYDFSEVWKAYADYTLVRFGAHDPIYPTLSDPTSTAVYTQSVVRGEASAVVSNNYGATNGTMRLYYSYGNHFIDDPRHFHSTDDRLGLLIYQNFAPWRGASATAGFDFARYTGRIPVSGGRPHQPGSLTTLDRRNITEYSPYLTLSQEFADGLLTLGAGVRGAFSNKFGAHVVPQGGFALNLPEAFTIKGSIAVGYRNPSFRELYLYKFANPDLGPERMTNYEISLTKDFGHGISSSLTAYYIQGSDMIQQTPEGNRNTGRFINKGIEATAQWRATGRLRLWSTYSYLHSSLTNLTGAPRHQYFVGIEWLPARTLSLDASLSGAGRLYVAPDVHLQSYATLNIKARWQLLPMLALSLRADNITDARYTINKGYPMPGICIYGGISVEI